MSLYTDLAENEIRLLDVYPGAFDDPITTTLRVVSLASSDRGSYQALSYVWGAPELVEDIGCNGVTTRITTNLMLALRYIRSKTETIIMWADALCINQDDTTERNNQVLLMRHVYIKAETVIIWVGEADADTADVMQWFEDLDEHFESETHSVQLEYLIQDDDFCSTLLKVKDFVSRPWFHRAWTFPEACLASSARVHCGHLVLPWLTLCSASIIARNMNLSDRAFGVGKEYIASLAYYSVMSQVGTQFHLGALLRETRSRIAGDPKDKIYSLLGLLTRTDFQPNYEKSVRDVYCQVAKDIMSLDDNLDMLSNSNGVSNIHGLPSWVPDWREGINALPLCRYSDDRGVEGGVGPDFSASLGFVPITTILQGEDLSRLNVGGRRLTRISSIWPLEDLLNIIRDHIQDWKRVIQSILTFLSQINFPATYEFSNESIAVAFLRTLSADTLPITPKVRTPLRQAKFPWHHDWFRQEIDIDLKTIRKQKIVRYLKVDSATTKAKYRAKSFQMTDRIRHVYEDLFREVLGTSTVHAKGSKKWAVEHLLRLTGDTRPTTSYFVQETTKSRVVVEMVNSILEWAQGRSFCTSEQGLMGLCPQQAVVGDEIHILCGAKVPFVLRAKRDEPQRHELVGECFLHGIMYGEAIRGRGPSKRLRIDGPPHTMNLV